VGGRPFRGWALASIVLALATAVPATLPAAAEARWTNDDARRAIVKSARYWSAHRDRTECRYPVEHRWRRTSSEVWGYAEYHGCLLYEGRMSYIVLAHRSRTRLNWVEFCTLVIHEYGHLLGYRHSSNPDSVMYGERLSLRHRACRR
jgi:hypothetical protein